MPYNYTNGDGPTVLIPTEPANSDSIKNTCAQSIRQIKAFLNDPVAGFVKVTTDIASLFATASNHETRITVVEGVAASAAAGKNIFKSLPSVDQDEVLVIGVNNFDIALGAETFDPDGNFNPATGLFTAPTNGYYEFHCSIRLEIVAGVATVVRAGGGILGSSGELLVTNTTKNLVGAGNAEILVGSGLMALAAGQTVKLTALVDTDAAITVRVTADFTSFYGQRAR